MAIGELLLVLAVLVAAFASLGLAMWIIYRIGLFIAVNMYGERLGLSESLSADE